MDLNLPDEAPEQVQLLHVLSLQKHLPEELPEQGGLGAFPSTFWCLASRRARVAAVSRNPSMWDRSSTLTVRRSFRTSMGIFPVSKASQYSW